MYRLVDSKQGLGVVQVSDNGRLIAENYGFNSKRSALKNIWSRIENSIEWIDTDYACGDTLCFYFQDDRLALPVVFVVDKNYNVTKTSITPHKRYVPKKKK